ncbi:ABC transporter ATP-binding protein [Capsulimonas corticalis]|uniref:ABC transporter ATP-binding protein n=1 Tax=Capsulimonas corticalis TaxID=2219043 RepID=A0A402CXQ0_9BACT|nr:ABC transporter ATP-binding protein [Capsulimonas corticalis]BDI32227.1 ABC transporter ATP-binding protein [Capsulimonas corticalis]
MCDHHSPIEDRYRSDRPWRTLLMLYGQRRRTVALAIFFFIIKQSPTWVVPIVTANMIDAISKPTPHSGHTILINTIIGVVSVALNSPFHTIYYHNMASAARTAEATLRSAICRRLQQLNISYYKHKSSGVLQSKALRDVESIDQMTRSLFEMAMGAAIALVSAIVVTALRAPKFLPFFLLAIPPVVIMQQWLSKRMRKINKEFREEVEGMSSKIVSMIDMIPIARAHAVEDVEIEKIDRQLDQVKQAGIKVDYTNALFLSSAWSMFTMLNLLGFAVAGWVCFKKIMPMTPGDVVLIGGYFSSITGAVLSICNIFPNIARGFEAIRSIGDVLESPDIERNRGKQSIPNVRGGLRFDQVAYRYPGGETDAITDFTLDVPAGRTVALVGPSGSGKSTMMGLVLGFQRPTAGRILLDGSDIEALDLRDFREYVAVVSQETLLFQGTLRENILYGTLDVTDERLRQAIRDANAEEFVSRLPAGLDTIIGEKGARLSGGQKQRIAIARAIIREPRVLILDEATSALDGESERVVQEALDRLMKGRTTLIVAHRLSTIRNADTIVVLENGHITESGSLPDLLDRNGTFADMWRLQTEMRFAIAS